MTERGGLPWTAMFFGLTLVACDSASNHFHAPNGTQGGMGGGVLDGKATGGDDSGGGSRDGDPAMGGGGRSGNDGSGGASSVMGNGGTSGAGGSPGGCAQLARGKWVPISTVHAPAPRTGAWTTPTGDGVLVWGGTGAAAPGAVGPHLVDGAIYSSCDDSWTPMTAPSALITASAAPASLATWTGSGLVVWGGVESPAVFNGYPEGKRALAASIYDARTDSWREMNRLGGPTAREYEARVWTGKRLLIWGGVAQSGDKSWANHLDGALYDPASDRWTPMSTANAPSGRAILDQYAWTGSELIVWGGLRFDPGSGFQPVDTPLMDGGVYDPASDRWSPVATAGAPTHSTCEVFWTGSRLLVLCLLDGYTSPGTLLFDGALFDPSTNEWSKMSAPDAALVGPFLWGDGSRKTLWTGKALVVFGERIDPATKKPSGLVLVYDPAADAWRGKDIPATPSYGTWQFAEVVAGKVVFGGSGPLARDAAGADHSTIQLAMFDPGAMAFTSLPLVANRTGAALVVAAASVLLWGGQDTFTDLGAPNPCGSSPTVPCDPITPTRSVLLGDGLVFAP